MPSRNADPKQAEVLLKLTEPSGKVRELALPGDSAIVGSGSSAAIIVEDPRVSALHLMLKREKDGVQAVDLGSEGGTRLQGGRLTEPTALASGDVLELGGTKLRVTFGEATVTEVVTVPAAVVVDRVPPASTPVEAKSSETNSKQESKPKADSKRPEPDGKGGKKKGPPPPPREEHVSKKKPSGGKPASLFGGLRGRNASAIFYEELPPDVRPKADQRALDVALIWGDAIMEASQFDSGSVTIGQGIDADFHVYVDTVEKHVLATVNGSQASITAPPGGTILLRKGGKEEKAGTSATIGLEDVAKVQFGTLEFVLRFIRPPHHEKTGLLEQVDLYFTKVLSIAVMAHAILLAAMLVTPLDDALLSEDLFKNPNRYTKLILKSPDKKKLDLSGIKEGAKPKDDEGKFGKKEEKKKDADPSKKGAQKVDANKREEDRKKVLAAGLLGAMSDDGAASNIFGPGGLGTGINQALGGLQGGAGMGDAHGVGGLGSRGAGSGGGGTGLGLGGLGTKGGGRGAGGYGSIDLGGKGKGSTRIVPGKTTVVGGLSKEVIGKVIRKHWNEIKYCYEKELQKEPNLEGKVAIMFVIGGAGGVDEASVQQDTMGSGGVSECMVSKIKRWKFPEPQGGGQVMVTYPWIFRAAGGAETGEE